MGGSGPLQTINIPIGIFRFSAWGRQEPPKPQEYVISIESHAIHQNLAEFSAIYIILLGFGEFPPFGVPGAETSIFPKEYKAF